MLKIQEQDCKTNVLSTFSLPESARPDIGLVPNVVLGKSTEGAINKKAVIVRKTINTSYRFQGHN